MSDNPPLPAARRLTSELIGRLTNDIVTGKAAPRARLPTEHALMDRFGVSRTVVREAIAALRADGLVETRRGAGAFVTADPGQRPFRIDPDDLQTNQQILDVMELRMCVEVEAAGLAARRRSAADVAKPQATSAGNSPRPSTPATKRWISTSSFMPRSAAATGNPYFSSFLRFLGRMIIPRRRRYAGRMDEPGLTRYLRRLHREHEAIVRAIAARDVAGARRAMRSHLKRGRERYRPARDGTR